MIYIVVDEYEDLETHFDLENVFSSKEELLKGWASVKKERGGLKGDWNVYCTEGFASNQVLTDCDKKAIEKEFQEIEEKKLYLKLKKKFEPNG